MNRTLAAAAIGAALAGLTLSACGSSSSSSDGDGSASGSKDVASATGIDESIVKDDLGRLHRNGTLMRPSRALYALTLSQVSQVSQRRDSDGEGDSSDTNTESLSHSLQASDQQLHSGSDTSDSSDTNAGGLSPDGVESDTHRSSAVASVASVEPNRPCGHPGDPTTRCGACIANRLNGRAA